MVTNIYIDGFNFYYGAVKGTPYKWLNFAELCRILLPRHRIRRFYYFTAMVESRPGDPDQSARQQTYLRALKTLPNFTIVLGSFLSHVVTMPLANGRGYVDVIKTQEKGSDVNLAANATFIKHIRPNVLAVSQFPATLTDARGKFGKPASW